MAKKGRQNWWPAVLLEINNWRYKKYGCFNTFKDVYLDANIRGSLTKSGSCGSWGAGHPFLAGNACFLWHWGPGSSGILWFMGCTGWHGLCNDHLATDQITKRWWIYANYLTVCEAQTILAVGPQRFLRILGLFQPFIFVNVQKDLLDLDFRPFALFSLAMNQMARRNISAPRRLDLTAQFELQYDRLQERSCSGQDVTWMSRG